LGSGQDADVGGVPARGDHLSDLPRRAASLQEIHDHLEMRRKERDPAIEQREIAETKQMPCDVLVKNKVIREGSKKQYEFLDFKTYTPQQLTAIVALCEGRIADWNRTRSIEE
jgi:hypothetical protein